MYYDDKSEGNSFLKMPVAGGRQRKEHVMGESVYKVIELVGVSTESWEKAATTAVETAAKTLKDLRIAEVVQQDLQVEDGKIINYRVKVKLSFKYHPMYHGEDGD